jgi:hypothetical protein
VKALDDINLPVGTRDAWMPRGYLIPAEYGDIAAKLVGHNIAVEVLEEAIQAEGEEFVITELRLAGSRGFQMRLLDGEFVESMKEFPAGTYFVDMAQPMANAAFYYLEPQAADGFVGWGVMDRALEAVGAGDGPGVYPVFKLRRKGW